MGGQAVHNESQGGRGKLSSWLQSRYVGSTDLSVVRNDTQVFL